jgi:hypothetical protein
VSCDVLKDEFDPQDELSEAIKKERGALHQVAAERDLLKATACEQATTAAYVYACVCVCVYVSVSVSVSVYVS